MLNESWADINVTDDEIIECSKGTQVFPCEYCMNKNRCMKLNPDFWHVKETKED